MKTLLILVTFCWLTPFPQCLKAQNAEENFNKLKWLEGTWIRTNNKEGRSGQERWVQSSPSEFKGYSFTMKESDTLFVERINIRIMDHQLYYVADVPENNKPIYFKLTEVTPTGFVCENPEHDFPKKITYEYKDNIPSERSFTYDWKFYGYFTTTTFPDCHFINSATC